MPMQSPPSASSARAGADAHAHADAHADAHASTSASTSTNTGTTTHAQPLASTTRSSNFFRRSSTTSIGANMLARITSSSSQRPHAKDAVPDTSSRDRRPSIGRRISSRASRKSADSASGANLAELSRATGKFRSGVNWGPQQAPEPFMEAFDTSPSDQQLVQSLRAEASLASGSTAAAQAHLQSRGLGQPIFAERPSISSAAASATTASSPPSPTSPIAQASISQLPTVSQTISALGSSGVNPDVLGDSYTYPSRPPPSASAAVPTMHVEDDASPAIDPTAAVDGASPPMTPPVKSRQPSHSDNGEGTTDNHMVARAAQLVLEAARQQARVETRRKGRSAPASPKRMSSSLSPIPTVSNDVNGPESAVVLSDETEADLSRSPSQRNRSKSDAGGEGVQRRKSFLRAMSSRSRRDKKNASEGSETPTPTSNSPAIASTTSSGTTTPGGRRRRYVDTRDLDLLARELAAEAIADQLQKQQSVPPFARASRSGSSSPLRSKAANVAFNDPRRRSFPSILEDAPLQDDSITPASLASSGLKPMTPLSPRLNARTRAAEARSASGFGPNSGAAPPDPTNGLVPKEMFLGLGGSPYPSLPPSAARAGVSQLDSLDPFGIPLTQESSPFDATTAYANKTSVYHTPNQVAVSRSLSGASTWSTAQTSPNAKRRPVLTMTMNDPETELQGLTKPPKEQAKRLAPFGSRSASRAGSRAGSRASSRAPSPSPSFTDLRKEAAAASNASDGSTEAVTANDASIVESKPVSAPHSEGNSIHVSSRRNSMATSDNGSRSALALPKSKKMSRLSTIFRPNRAKEEAGAGFPAIDSSVKASSTAASSAAASTYGTPAGEMSTLALSPESAAVSADSDADVSPVAFRAVELPSTQDPRRSAPASTNASCRSSVALEPTDRPAPKKRPIRALLRRLSSFSKGDSKEAAKETSAKANFPDASTMPVVDMDKIRQLAAQPDAKTAAPIAQEAMPETSNEAASPGAKADEAAASKKADLDLSNASPAPLNEEMAKNGFGTRSAYKLGPVAVAPSDAHDHGGMKEGAEKETTKTATVESEDNPGVPSLDEASKEADKGADREDGWDRPRAALLQRADSQTPCSEDSFFLGSGQSSNSRPGSGALMKHGSESAMSEELHTPDPSTAYLPATKADAIDEATLSSAVSDVTAAAVAAATASGQVASPAPGMAAVVTTMPIDETQRLTAV